MDINKKGTEAGEKKVSPSMQLPAWLWGLLTVQLMFPDAPLPLMQCINGTDS
jgi:hypothetical protein